MQVVWDRSREEGSHKDAGPVGEKDEGPAREGRAILRETPGPTCDGIRGAGGVTRGQTTEMRGEGVLTFFTADWK